MLQLIITKFHYLQIETIKKFMINIYKNLHKTMIIILLQLFIILLNWNYGVGVTVGLSLGTGVTAGEELAVGEGTAEPSRPARDLAAA